MFCSQDMGILSHEKWVSQIRLNIHMNELDDIIVHQPPDFFSLSAARLACISAFFWEADLPAFSCCLVFLGALPAASASFFFWLLDLGGILSLLTFISCR